MNFRDALSNCALAAVLLLVTSAMAAPIPGIGPVGEIERVQNGFEFTEGPAVDGSGNVFFTDIPPGRIYRLDGDGKLSVFLEPSGHANGLMFNAGGTLFACQMEGQLVSIDPASKNVTVLAAEHQGKRFNAPNDLVLDQSGGIYFTDPRYRAPQPLPQGTEAVYYLAADGKVTRLIDNLQAPNGVILSPDEKTLYVVPSMQKEVWAYPIQSPGKLGPGRIFFALKQPEGKENSGGDGLSIDTQGNLYIATQLGLQVVSPQGELLGILEFPEQPANVTFGGPDRKTLFVTARTSLYSAKMEAQGHAFPGAK